MPREWDIKSTDIIDFNLNICYLTDKEKIKNNPHCLEYFCIHISKTSAI